MATLMQMWNMVILPEGAGAPATAITQTHGLPAENWQPGMRGHIQTGQMGIESGIGPSYGPGTPYTVTNTQNIIAAILKNSSREDSYPLQGDGGGAKINTMAPAGSPKQVAPEVVAKNTNGPTNVVVGSGQAKKTVTTAPLAGSSESSGGKTAAEVIIESMQVMETPSKTSFEDFTQQALQAEPAATHAQAVKNNTKNSNKVNGRKAVGGARSQINMAGTVQGASTYASGRA